MPYTEFCCRSGGSNLNAGTRKGNSTEPGTSPLFTYASGSWVAATGVFTVASGDPAADGVEVGDFASVYADGSTVTGFVGRVTARDWTTITVSLTAKSGTAPTDGSGNRTLRIGGAWAGPSGSVTFPFLFAHSDCKNAAGSLPRVNFKNDQTYAMTAGIASSNTYQYMHYEGYSTAYGDNAKAVFSWASAVAGSYGFIANANFMVVKNIHLKSSATSGNDIGFLLSSASALMTDCVSSGWRLRGIFNSAAGSHLRNCEVYDCSLTVASNAAGILVDLNCNISNCIVHDCKSHGFLLTGAANSMKSISSCIAETNAGNGIFSNGAALTIDRCDLYNNSLAGVLVLSSPILYVRSCNFVKNGRYGIEFGTSTNAGAYIENNGFGSGTQANSLGAIETEPVSNRGFISNSITYPADLTPWNNPESGDFSIVLPQAKGVGYGSFVQTQAGYSGTVGYPDIGAAQSKGGGIRPVNIRGGADQ